MIIDEPNDQPEKQSLNDWISALDAVHFLARHYGDVTAKQILLSRLEDGCLSLRATVAIQEGDIGSLREQDWLWPDRPQPRHRHQRDKIFIEWTREGSATDGVPSDFFARADSWNVDRDSLNWSRGIIVARRPARIIRLPLRVRVTVGGGVQRQNLPEAHSPMVRRAVVGLVIKFSELEAMLSGGHASRRDANSDGSVLSGAIAPPAVSGGLNWKAAMDEVHQRISDRTMAERFGHFNERGTRRQIIDFLRTKVLRHDGTPISQKHAQRMASEIIDRWRSVELGQGRVRS